MTPTLTYTPWSGCDIDNIKTLSQTTLDTLKFSTEDLYEEWINNFLVKSAEGHICLKCGRDPSAEWSSLTTYEQNALRDIVERLTVNCINVAVGNKVGKIVKVSDYNIQMSDPRIMTADLKELLESFVTTTSVSETSDYATGNMQQRWGES